MEKLIINSELKKWITPLTADEYAGLEKSIRTEGCRDAIVTWFDPGVGLTIIDGHNRFEICHKHGILFDTVVKEFDNIEDVKDWIDFNQLSRRNLTDSQREIIIGRRYNREKKKQGAPEGNDNRSIQRGKICPFESVPTPTNSPPSDHVQDLFAKDIKPSPPTKPVISAMKTAEKLAEEYKVSPRTVKNYAATAAKFDQLQQTNPQLADDIFSGKKTFAEVKKEEKKTEKLQQKAFVAKQMPEDTFDLIYCDPPWQYDFAETDNRKIENQYPTMTVDQICTMKLPKTAKDCLLLMWATAPKLLEALDVIDAWGFKYKTHSIWDKVKIGMGYWFRGQHELLIVATKGNFSPPEPEHRKSSLYSESRGIHSKKPEYYYEWIESAFPYAHKIELFARNDRKNWKSWGNE